MLILHLLPDYFYIVGGKAAARGPMMAGFNSVDVNFTSLT